MRLFSVLLIACLLRLTGSGWGTDLEEAKKTAEKEHKFILLNFSGSDWCGPCIKMHDEIFESKAFKDFAATNLVLVNADFPRLKKNQLSKEQSRLNETLADKYNQDGKFPFTVLLNPDGKVLKSWEGYPDKSPEKFVEEVNSSIHALR